MPNLKRLINNWNYLYFKDAPIHISGVSLDKHSISLATEWQTEQLIATITPEEAVDSKALIWTSSDTSIATVSNTGLVTCVTPWDCTITVTTTYGWFTDSCNIINRKDVYVDFMLIAWWGWGWKNYGWWGGAWWVIQCSNYFIDMWCYPIVIWAGWSWVWSSCMWKSWCNSTFNSLIAYWGWAWWGWGSCLIYWLPWWSGWWWWYVGQQIHQHWWDWCTWQWYKWGCAYRYWSWWWGWAWWAWANWSNWTDSWWIWGIWIQSDIDWTCKWYAWGWSWHNASSWCWVWASCWGTPSWSSNSNATICWAWGWGSTSTSYWNWASWIFILRYPTSSWYDLTGWCKYTCWNYTIHCFTSSWDLIVN